MTTANLTYGKSEFARGIILGLTSAIFILIISGSLKTDIYFFRLLLENKIIILLALPAILTIWVYSIYKIASRRLTALQFGKFVAVGQSNAAIDIGVTNLFIILTNIDSGSYFIVFKCISFICALVHSFIWNKFWSFQCNDRQKVRKQFILFVIVAVIALLVNVVTAHIVVNIIGPQWGLSSRVWASVGVLSSALFSMIWDFYGFKMLVFKK